MNDIQLRLMSLKTNRVLSSEPRFSASANASVKPSGGALPSPETVRQKWLAEHPKPQGMDVTLLQRLLDHDNHAMRDELRRFLSSSALFIPEYDIPLHRERELALERLRAICTPSGRFISVRDFWENPLRVFAAHEIVGFADGSLATKLTVQFNLAGGTVLQLGTQKHHEMLLDGIDSLANIGCFALTELAYGNNAVVMETTAVYEPHAQQFVINTPSVGAQKYWITVSGIICVC